MNVVKENFAIVWLTALCNLTVVEVKFLYEWQYSLLLSIL